MSRRRVARAAGALVLLCASLAVSSQPANDHFANAEVIDATPFSDVEPDQHLATSEAADPYVTCRNDSPATGLRGAQSIWYRFTPSATEYFNIATTASTSGNTMLAVYTGDALASLQLVAGGCSDDHLATQRSSIAGLRLEAGTTYTLEVARFATSSALASMVLDVTVAPRYPVTTLTDGADGNCDSDCSLREAITAANAVPGVVLLPAGIYTLTLSGADDLNATGDLDLRGAMGIYGAGGSATAEGGTTISQLAPGERVFHLPAMGAVSVHLHGLRFSGGNVDGDGGGLLSIATITANVALDHVTVSNNTASGRGGGASILHAAQFHDTTFMFNTAGTSGGGLALVGPRFSELARSSLVLNTANGTAAGAGGGGLVQVGGMVVLRNSSVAINAANGSGGGVFAALAGGTLGVYGSTVANNTADADNDGSGTGAGIRLEAVAAGHPIELSILSGNVTSPGTVATPSDCSRSASAGAIVSRYTFAKHPEAGCTFSGPGDRVGVDPGFASTFAPAENGTFVVPIAVSSPAVDAGDPSGQCRDEQNRALAMDQGTRARPFSIRCDPGAFEYTEFPDALFSHSFE